MDKDEPTISETKECVMQLKNNKAMGPRGEAAEMYKAACEEFLGSTSEALASVHAEALEIWRGTKPPSAHTIGDGVLIYKNRGSRNDVGNFRMIMLLAIASKVVAMLMNKKILKPLVEHICDDTHNAYRDLRGPRDPQYVVRRIMEMFRNGADEGNLSRTLKLLFVDLKKAYPSVHHGGMWMILEKKLHVPPNVVLYLKRVHALFKGSPVIEGKRAPEPFRMTNGLREGCPLSCALLNIYFHFIVMTWREVCRTHHGDDFGVKIEYGTDGIIRKESAIRNGKAKQCHTVSDEGFADDMVTVNAAPNEQFRREGEYLNGITKDFGGCFNLVKLEWMEVKHIHQELARTLRRYDKIDKNLDESELGGNVLYIGGQRVRKTRIYTYLGGLLASDRDLGTSRDIAARVFKMNTAVIRLRHVFRSEDVTRQDKKMLAESLALGVLLYGVSGWALRAEHLRKLRTAWNWATRKIANFTMFDMQHYAITHKQLRKKYGLVEIGQHIIHYTAGFIRHVGRALHASTEQRAIMAAFFGSVVGCRRTGRLWGAKGAALISS